MQDFVHQQYLKKIKGFIPYFLVPFMASISVQVLWPRILPASIVHITYITLFQPPIEKRRIILQIYGNLETVRCGGFLKWWYPKMDGWFGGTTIFGNLETVPCLNPPPCLRCSKCLLPATSWKHFTSNTTFRGESHVSHADFICLLLIKINRWSNGTKDAYICPFV